MKSGIYSITNKSNNRIYIGQSVDVARRLRDHKYLLMNDKHSNSYLQNQFKKYGIESFSFDVIEFCPVSELDDKERKAIDIKDSTNRSKGFNRESGGNKLKTFPDYRIKAISGEGNPMFGKRHSEEFVEMITLRNRGSSDLLDEKDVEKIKLMFLGGREQRDIAKEFNVHFSTVNKILKLKNWEWVRTDLNERIADYIQSFKDAKEIEKQRKSREKKERIETKSSVIKCFKNGMNREENKQEHNISNTTYIRYISEEYNRQKESKIERAKSLKNKNMLNKDIAKELGIHRTTVTEYLKN